MLNLRAAITSIDAMMAKSGEGKEGAKSMGELAFYKGLIEEWIADHLAQLEKLKSTNDLYYFNEVLKSNKKYYGGVKTYDTACKAYDVFLSQGDSQSNLTEGKEFYYIIRLLSKQRSKILINRLKRFADEHEDSIYGKMAASLHSELEKNPNAPINLQKHRRLALGTVAEK
jgi:hypothetical protein